jgi:hypothetical protein
MLKIGNWICCSDKTNKNHDALDFASGHELQIDVKINAKEKKFPTGRFSNLYFLVDVTLTYPKYESECADKNLGKQYSLQSRLTCILLSN